MRRKKGRVEKNQEKINVKTFNKRLNIPYRLLIEFDLKVLYKPYLYGIFVLFNKGTTP